MAIRRLVVAEETGGVLRVLATRAMDPGDRCSVGREAELVIGHLDDPPDRRVSRTAVSVTCTADGWQVRSVNRNGVIVHPWAQPASMAQPLELLTAARVGLRVIGTLERRHWVLLEDDHRLDPAGSPVGTVRTDLDVPVRPLTGPQLQVLRLLFGDLLLWPPRVSPEPLQLKQVANRLGLSVSAVQARLADVRAKALQLGLARQVPLLDPEYLYVLARAGYLRPDPGDHWAPGSALNPSG